MADKRRRGRPRQTPSGRTAVFSTRIEPELRRKLEQAAQKGGVNLTAVIARRLKDSFQLDDRIERIYASFGGSQNYAVLRAFAEIMKRIDAGTGKRWTDDPWAYAQVEQAISYLLAEWRPEGAPVKPVLPERAPVAPGIERLSPPEIADDLGLRLARFTLAFLYFVEEREPDTLARIKTNLGPLANRGGAHE